MIELTNQFILVTHKGHWFTKTHVWTGWRPCLYWFSLLENWERRQQKKGIKEDASRIASFNEKTQCYLIENDQIRDPLWKCSPAFLHQIVNLTQYDISHFLSIKYAMLSYSYISVNMCCLLKNYFYFPHLKGFSSEKVELLKLHICKASIVRYMYSITIISNYNYLAITTKRWLG